MDEPETTHTLRDRIRRAAPHADLLCGAWVMITLCLLPLLLIITEGDLGWVATTGLAALLGLIVVILVALADDVPEDSKYDA